MSYDLQMLTLVAAESVLELSKTEAMLPPNDGSI